MTLNKIFTYPGFSAIILALILSAGVSSCNGDKKIKGSEFIQRDVFVKVLTDMHLMDGITNDMKYYRKFTPADSIDLYSSIFEKYGVTRDLYMHTVEEYSKYPELFNDIYDEVLMNLNMLLEEVEASGDDQVITPEQLPEHPNKTDRKRK